jgi:hypothetical protein
MWQGYELYVAAARDPDILRNCGRGTPEDWLERNVYGRFPVLGISLYITLQMVLFGVPAITMLFTHRMHVLRDYRRRVIRPVFRQLTRQASLLDAQGGQKLRQLLRRYDVLRAVVEFRDRLQRIWDETSSNDAPALDQLRMLCTDAECSHVPALTRFAQRLPTYASPDRTPRKLQ